jgi:hypothetical protein
VAIVGGGFVIVFLARLDEAEMREGFRVVRVAFCDSLPGRLRFGVPSLLLQGKRVLAGVALRRGS